MNRVANASLLAALGWGLPLASARDVGSGGGRPETLHDRRLAAASGWGGPASGDARPFAKSAKGKGKASSKGAATGSKGEKAGKSTEAGHGDRPSSEDTEGPQLMFAKSAKHGKSAKGKAGKTVGPFAKSGKGEGSKGSELDAWGAAGTIDDPADESEEMPDANAGDVPPSDAEIDVDDANAGDVQPGDTDTDVNDTSTGDEQPSGTDVDEATVPPTPRPTCNRDTPPEDFNLCISLDSSGSVCSKGITLPCERCSPSLLCQDFGFDRATCCRNYDTVKDFASSMVDSLDELPGEKSFSIVRFSTAAEVYSSLASAEDTLSNLDAMEYIGGYTNHASAIRACRETFVDGADDRKKVMLLVTDGVPTWPQDLPEGSAVAAAGEAKEDGATIIPVFISPRNDEDALGFMQRLSSDGRVFDVTDFGALEGLQDVLVDQVSCS